jgi:cystathionine beta-synthase
MIDEAERTGKLKPGGTIVEPTSGNTGVGLALAAAIKGYKMIFVVPDKVALEKIALLRAFGADVVICPTAVDADSPESYYLVSDRLAEEIPGAYKPDQYSNQGNPDAHYRTTGPEIWEQMGGELDVIVMSVGTGGSITGTARYLKEQKPDIVVVGADPEGSIYSGGPVHPYLVEGIGKDGFPASFDPSVVDEYVSVSDRNSFLMTRRLAREEGILAGGSGGTSVCAMLETAKSYGPETTILTTIPDGGRGYLSKIFDDNWMLEHGFLERHGAPDTVEEVLAFKHADNGVPALVTCEPQQKLGAAIELMQRYGISQLPVVRKSPAETLSDVIGSLNERTLLDRIFRNPDALGEEVAAAMQPPLAAVDSGDSVDEVFADLRGQNQAVVIVRNGKPGAVLTRSDLLEYLAHRR